VGTYIQAISSHLIVSAANSLEQVFKVPAVGETSEHQAKRALYNKVNSFFSSASLADIARSTQDVETYGKELSNLKREYDGLSATYQQNKGKAPIAFA
jgi:hypothetical protein